MNILQRLFGFQEQKSIISGDSLFLDTPPTEITNSLQAYQKSIYVSSCIQHNGTRISALGRSLEIEKNPLFTFSEIIYSIYAWCELEGYALVWYDGVTLTVLDQAQIAKIDKYTISYHQGQNLREIPRKEIVIIHNYSPFLHIYGQPALTEAVLDIANTSYKQTQAVQSFYDHGMFANSYMTTDQGPQNMQIDLLKEQIKNIYSGHKNAGRIPILHSGLKIVPLSLSPDQFKQLASDNVTLELIAMAFGVPPLVLGRMESGWDNKEPIMEHYITNTIIPKAELLAEQINKFILPLVGVKGTFEFDTVNIPELQKAKLSQSLAYTPLVAQNIMTINEVRANMGLDPVSWGNEPRQPQVMSFSQEPDVKKSFKVDIKTIANDNHNRVERFSKQMRPKFKDYFKQMKKDILKELKEMELPDDAKTLTIPSKYKDKVTSIARQYLPGMYYDAGQSVILAYGQKGYKTIGISFNLEDPYVQQMLEQQVILLSQNIYENSVNLLSEKVRGVLKQARSEGLGITDTMKLLTDQTEGEFNGWMDYRAERIARTESTRANTRGSTEGARQNGMNAKSWLPSGASNPREEHAAMDSGNFIPLDAYFDVGGTLMYGPGDGPASETVNCGCSLLYDWR